jgi:hypothetical protein
MDSSLNSFFNSLETLGNIKVENNYGLSDTSQLAFEITARADCMLPHSTIRTLAQPEIFASKIVAWIYRAAARGNYLNNMIHFWLFNKQEISLLQICALFHHANSINTAMH